VRFGEEPKGALFGSADIGVLFGMVDDSQPEQEQQIVGRNGFLEEGQPGFAEPGPDFEDRVVGQRDDVTLTIAEVGERDEIHGLVFEEIHIDDQVARRVGRTDLPGLGQGRASGDTHRRKLGKTVKNRPQQFFLASRDDHVNHLQCGPRVTDILEFVLLVAGWVG